MPLIVFEGPDDSGKTTQAKILEDSLKSLGYLTMRLREPGGTPLGESVRAILMQHKTDPLTAAFLLSASRRHMVNEMIVPALLKGVVVVLDRYYFSQLVYQELPDQKLNKMLCRLGADGVHPSIKIGLMPVSATEKDDSELPGSPERNVIIERYRAMYDNDQEWFTPTGTIEEVSSQILEMVIMRMHDTKRGNYQYVLDREREKCYE